jgi:hypothetical protein
MLLYKSTAREKVRGVSVRHFLLKIEIPETLRRKATNKVAHASKVSIPKTKLNRIYPCFLLQNIEKLVIIPSLRTEILPRRRKDIVRP